MNDPNPILVVQGTAYWTLDEIKDELRRQWKIEKAARDAVVAYDDKLGASWRNSCEALRETLRG